jgi:protein tyrosine phosphatase
MGQDKCHQYWPSERSIRYQYVVVEPVTEYSMPQYILREFKMTDARDGQSRTVRQFQFTDWPEEGVPKSGEGFIDFLEGVVDVFQTVGILRTQRPAMVQTEVRQT